MGNLSLFKEILQAAVDEKAGGMTVVKSGDKFRLLDSHAVPLGECRLELFAHNKSVTLWSLHVSEGCKTAGLGRLFTQAVGVFAQELERPRIDIKMVQKDGLSFWPHMGAQPATGFGGYEAALMRVAKFKQTPAPERKKLLTLFQIADKHQEKAWFRMTEKSDPLRVSRESLRHVGQQLYNNDALTICLDHPVVRQRLGLA